jgi:phosphonate transport system substrate-binding protein
MKKFKMLAILTGSILFLAGCQSVDAVDPEAWPEKIVYAGMPLDGTTEVLDSFNIMVQVLEDELGIDVELKEVSSGPAVTEALVSGQAQIGNLNGFAYVVAKGKYPELQLVAATQRRAGQEPGIFAYGIVRAENTEIYSLADLVGKKVCYGTPSSMVAFMAPASELAQLGIDGNPETSKQLDSKFVGDGINTAYALANRDCEASFLADSTLNFSVPATGDLKVEDFRIFWESKRLPSSAFVFGPNIPNSLQLAIKSLLLEKLNKTWLVENGKCSDEETCLFLNRANWGWVEVEEQFYDVVRDMCRYVESENCSASN